MSHYLNRLSLMLHVANSRHQQTFTRYLFIMSLKANIFTMKTLKCDCIVSVKLCIWIKHAQINNNFHYFFSSPFIFTCIIEKVSPSLGYTINKLRSAIYKWLFIIWYWLDIFIFNFYTKGIHIEGKYQKEQKNTKFESTCTYCTCKALHMYVFWSSSFLENPTMTPWI